MPERTLGQRIKHLRGDARRDAIAKVLADFASSKQSAAAFCESVGIATVTLARWRRELGGARRARTAKPNLVEVRPARDIQTAPFELSFPSGVRVRVPCGFDAAELGRLLATIRPTC